jgi:cytochrome c biogenesis protein CcmG, thiol:disulfide interchange protein DsbE
MRRLTRRGTSEKTCPRGDDDSVPDTRTGSAKLVGVRTWLILVAVLAIVVVGVVGILQVTGDDDPTAAPSSLSAAEVTKPLAGQPAALAALHARSGELVPGGLKRFDSQLRALRGTPVVVNLWASWCGPCRFEIPFIQRAFLQHGTKVAFLGVNSDDADGNARKMLATLPMPYPSVVDDRANLAGRLGARGLPVTVFYDASGKEAYVHQGAYPSEAKLSEDIEKYLS